MKLLGDTYPPWDPDFSARFHGKVQPEEKAIFERKSYPGLKNVSIQVGGRMQKKRKLDKLVFISNLCSGGSFWRLPSGHFRPRTLQRNNACVSLL